MNKRILNIYKSRHIAQAEFKIACSNLHIKDAANYTSLSIEGDGTTTIFGYCSDYNSFCQKYLQGTNWSEVNDFANLPYDVWTMAQSRVRK